MASCLGISVGKNLIKYAKLSKEKGQASVTIEAYGVKFYDILTQTVSEIIQETKSNDASVSVCLTSEDYEKVECFKQIKSKKERDAMLNAEFEELCAKKNVNTGSLDVRYILADDPDNPEQYRALCVAASKVELNNLWQALSTTKFESISAVGSSIVNLLREKGAGSNCLIINIEDDTKLTLLSGGNIQDLIQIPVGMDEVIARLADKYNSYARAYEACKGVDAYSDADTLAFDPDTQSIRDSLMPTLYDLKQRIMMATEDYLKDIQDVYITGTGIIVNNIDLYLAEAFPGKHVEILVPYFVNKERNSLKDVLEVNSALAAANYCLDGIDKEQDFLASGNYLKKEARSKKLAPKEIFATITSKVDEINKKTLKTRKTGRKKKKKIEFDNEVENLGQLGGSGEYAQAPAFEEEVEYYDPMAEWFTRLAMSLFVGFIAYTSIAMFVEKNLDNKLLNITKNITTTDEEIKKVDNDTTLISKKAEEYKDKTAKLQKIIDSIRLKKENSYDVPNFMSQLMFIIPAEVNVSSIQVGTDDTVILEASSGRYAQLGYFVSRLKLAGVLKEVEMNVVDMSSDIKIKIRGVLP